ncbi:hypothetical protein [Amaricoccus sp.]|uniref:hypothetical protein n=1 Tax=Amaricoccus sp. TaxID=1872485 RepID=UPI002633B4C3|nr:hypothetical protein [uncultured Amaricoccus sp.]
MRLPFLLGACGLLLAACDAKAVNGPPGIDDPGGGAAANKGALYCQTVPTNIYDRAEWNRVCKPFD